MWISDTQLPTSVVQGRHNDSNDADELSMTSRKRAHSFDIAEDCRVKGLLDRIQHTHEYKWKGFKGNMRGSHIHGPFTTLHELLTTLPEDVAIDIELSKWINGPYFGMGRDTLMILN
jgi:glycerophosphodiester phosphodiesterase